jgi:hypothetical protein
MCSLGYIRSKDNIGRKIIVYRTISGIGGSFIQMGKEVVGVSEVVVLGVGGGLEEKNEPCSILALNFCFFTFGASMASISTLA